MGDGEEAELITSKGEGGLAELSVGEGPIGGVWGWVGSLLFWSSMIMSPGYF